MMKRRNKRSQLGFTLTEMLVALAAASGLIVSVGQMLSLSVRAYNRVTETVERVRTYRAIDQWMSVLQTTDIDQASLSDDQVVFVRGAMDRLRLVQDDTTLTTSLLHNGVNVERDYVFADDITWTRSENVFVLKGGVFSETLIAMPIIREVPYNCAYDPIAKRCR